MGLPIMKGKILALGDEQLPQTAGVEDILIAVVDGPQGLFQMANSMAACP